MLSCPTCQRSVEDGLLACPFDGTALSGAIGKLLGERYRVLSRLGSGAMGDVYLAEHVLLRKKMAVKVLKAELCRSEDLVRRFQQEAIAASSIGQENIVSITDFGRTDDGSLYFVMEALAGQGLTALLAGGNPLPFERVVPILVQLSRALGAAHAQGIVHRDLKADNVMVVPRDDGSDLVKVLDFGISKMSGGQEGGNRATQVGTVIGTPAYMAPEQARGDAVDQRADIYSFGVLAYELVTGNVPFEAPTLTGVLMKHLSEMPVPPSVRCPHPTIPQRLEALILRALEKDPARRPQSMEAIREELLQVAQEIGVAPRYTPTPVPAVAMPRAFPATPVPGSGVTRPFAPTPVPRSPAFEESLAPTWIPSAHPSPVPRVKKRRTGRLVALGLLGVLIAAVVFRQAWVPLLPPGLAASEGRLEARIQRAVHALGTPPAKPLAPGVAAPVKAPVPTPPPQTPPAQTPQLATQSPVAPVPTVPPPNQNPVQPASQQGPVEPAVQHAVARHPSYLTANDIGRTLRRSGPQLRQCLKQYRAALPEKKGQLTLNVAVANSGEVEGAGFSAKELAGTPFEGCVVSAIKELKFPAHTNARNNHFEVPIEYGVND